MSLTKNKLLKPVFVKVVIIFLLGLNLFNEKASGQATVKVTSEKSFGAAQLVPSDVAFFNTTLRLKERWSKIKASVAFQQFLKVPLVQMGLQQVTQSPQYQQFQSMRKGHPLFAKIFNLLEGAVSNEIFIYGGKELSDVVSVLMSIYADRMSETLFAPVLGEEAAPFTMLANSILENSDSLKVPPIIFGFDVRQVEKPAETLNEFIEFLKAQAPLPLEKKNIGGGTFHSLNLNGEMVPPPVKFGLLNTLAAEGADEELIEAFYQYLNSLTVNISLGVHRGYLLLSFGSDSQHLKRFGNVDSLLTLPIFNPVKKHHKSGLNSISYWSKEIASSRKLTKKEVEEVVTDILEGVEEFNPSNKLLKQLEKDARGITNDFNDILYGEPSASITMEYQGNGIETLTFSLNQNSHYNSRGKLDILKLADPQSLAFSAARGKEFTSTYKKFAHAVKTFYYYFDKLFVPEFSQEDLVEYRKFEKSFVPTLNELHTTTQDLLLSSIDGLESLFVIDGQGRFQQLLPFFALRFNPPLHIPRPAFVFEVRDMAKLKAAFSNYRKTLNKLIQSLSDLGVDLPPLVIPEPESQKIKGGTLYSYTSLIGPQVFVNPNVVLTDKYLILSLFVEQSKLIAQGNYAHKESKVSLNSSSGMAYQIQVGSVLNLIFENVNAFLQTAVRDGVIDINSARGIAIHLPIAKKILSVFKAYQGRVYQDGEYLIQHTHLKIEDLKNE